MKISTYFKSGEAWIWLHAGTVAISLIMVVGIIGLLAVKGLGHFWPNNVLVATYTDSQGQESFVAGEIYEEHYESVKRLKELGVSLPIKTDEVLRYSLKLGNRDIDTNDFKWVFAYELKDLHYPADMIALERYEWGDFYGRLIAVNTGSLWIGDTDDAWLALQTQITRAHSLREQAANIEKSTLNRINYQLEKLRLEEKRLQLYEPDSKRIKAIDIERQELLREYRQHEAALANIYHELDAAEATFETVDGHTLSIAIDKIAKAIKPNTLSIADKLVIYFKNIWLFLSGDPREANTEGGVFPAIFGTVMMVLLMTIFVTPLGVIAAIYLREYAKQGVITQAIRVAVNNLAGVPSIVYGVFGLGFFVYFIGGSIDALFYAESAPAPVFGTPGILWAAMTLALLTLPVVIVSTEEGLSRVPRSLREGSLALGATRAETLWRIILPIATPGIMTGVILAIARAAGEVAPLMLVGVVKLAPALPVDFNAPFVHLDRKFMHLGFHIYDVGFQSPNVESARPLVFATAFLLVLVVALLNLSAIALRNHLRDKYSKLDSL